MAMNATNGVSGVSSTVPSVHVTTAPNTTTTDEQASWPVKVSSNTNGDLSPEAYLCRISGAPSTASREILAAAQSLSKYLVSAKADEQKRAELGRNLIRLCAQHRDVLLPLNVDRSLGACEACRNVAAQGADDVKYCCWFSPKPSQLALLAQLEAICECLFQPPEDMSDAVVVTLFDTM